MRSSSFFKLIRVVPVGGPRSVILCVWWVSGACLEGIWKVPGRCLEGIYRMSEWGSGKSGLTGQVRTCQVRTSGQVRRGQVRTGQVSTDQVGTGQVNLDQKLSQDRSTKFR